MLRMLMTLALLGSMLSLGLVLGGCNDNDAPVTLSLAGSGTLATDDSASNNSTYYDLVNIPASGQRRVIEATMATAEGSSISPAVIVMETAGAAASSPLDLYDENYFVADDDDFAGSYLASPGSDDDSATFIAEPNVAYTVVFTSESSAETGDYTYLIHDVTGDLVIPIGSGTIADTDAFSTAADQYYDYVDLPVLDENANLEVTMRNAQWQSDVLNEVTDDFDTYAYVIKTSDKGADWYGNDLYLIYSDDDGEGWDGHDSRFVFPAEAGVAYTVVFAGYDSTDLGAYNYYVRTVPEISELATFTRSLQPKGPKAPKTK